MGKIDKVAERNEVLGINRNFCSNCASQIYEDSKFCGKCGAQIRF
jgi:predicted amidophosphoribosyltransferase